MGTVGPMDCAGKRTVRGWMDVAQADPSFLGNAAVSPGLPSPWAACSVRTHCRRHGRATISTGSFPRGSPAARLWGSLYPQGSQTADACSALPPSPETSTAPDVSLSPCPTFRATWGALPGCCQPVLAHRRVVTLTTPTEAV